MIQDAAAVAERRPARRQEIVDAARAIAVEEGWAAVSVRRVAARVGCSAATLYGYLPDKDAILAAIVADGDDRLAQAMRQASADAGGPAKRLRAALRAYWEFVAANPALYRVMHGLGVARVADLAGGATARQFDALAADLARKRGRDDHADLAAALAAVLHGFAAFALDGRLPADRAGALAFSTVDTMIDGFGR